MRKRLIIFCLILTLFALALYPLLSRLYLAQRAALPPGISARENRLVRLWLIGDLMGADSYLKQQAAAYEKAHPGARIYLRSAPPESLTQPEVVLPDGVIFSPGAITAPQSILQPLAGQWPIAARLLACGQWQARQYALPLLMGGYALAEQADGEGFEAAQGVPLLLSPREQVTRHDLSQSQVYANFLARRSQRALLTLRQVRSLNLRDHRFTAHPLTLGFTDLLLAGGVIQPGSEALAFFEFLLKPHAQQALSEHALFSIDPALTLYDADTPLLAATEALFKASGALPSLFAYDPDRAQALSLGNSETQIALEQLQ